MTESGVARLAEEYSNNATIRGLIQLIPLGLGSALDSVIAVKWAAYQHERLRTFFDELAKGKVSLDPKIVKTEDFLHAFFATTRASLTTRRREKIQVFARLLRGAVDNDLLSGADEYEECLLILEDLSFREMQLLAILARLEGETKFDQMDNDLQRAEKVWPAFVAEVEAKIGISREDLDPLLVRLQRSGCYAEITGTYWDYKGGRGRLTQLFWKIDNLLDGLLKAVDSSDFEPSP